MITGFNTEVKHRNRVFHIQTEDKGAANPFIESLVYVGGEILVSKKTSYADVLQEARDDQAVQELMEQQHREMIMAVQRGHFDGPDGSLRVPEEMSLSAPARDLDFTPPSFPLPARASASADRTLDQVVLDYLASESEQIEVKLPPALEFLSGRGAEVKLKAEASASRRPVAGASVQVKILSTVGKPTVVYQGKTAEDGSCSFSFKVPAVSDGDAAVIIRVSSSAGSAEVKYLIKKES